MSGIQILVNDGFGIYVPQKFVESFDPTVWGFDIDDNDLTIIKLGPDNEYYWDAWDSIVRRAKCNSNGYMWYLNQDGDLFAFCEELMTDTEYYNFFGEHRQAAS